MCFYKTAHLIENSTQQLIKKVQFIVIFNIQKLKKARITTEINTQFSQQFSLFEQF